MSVVKQLVRGMSSYLKRPGTGELEHITEDEARQMIGEAPDRTKQLLFKMLWQTGARISEILEISPSDVNFEESMVTIHRKKRTDGAVQELPIPRELSSDLRIYCQERDVDPEDPIIDVHRKTAWQWTRKIGEDVLDRKVTPHMFRHGRAYYLLSQDVPGAFVARVLGHSTLGSIMQYFHPDTEDLRQVVEL
jgi:integrase/recombinase XerD